MIADPSEGVRAAVLRVQDRLLTTLQGFDPAIKQIHYEHGHPREIDETMRQYDKLPQMRSKKYPCVMLVEDLQFDYGSFLPILTCRIVIAHQTKEDWKSGERDEQTFIPVLRPIYEALKNELLDVGFFDAPNRRIVHTAYERKFWGRPSASGNQNEENKFCDFIDAIDMQNVKLTVLEQPC